MASEHPTQRCVAAGSAGYLSSTVWWLPMRNLSVVHGLEQKKPLDLSAVGPSFIELVLKQPWACIITNAQSFPLSPLLILYKQVHWNRHNLWVWTITRMVLHSVTVWDGISKSHYLQWNPSFSLSCHLFSWSKSKPGLERLPEMTEAWCRTPVWCRLLSVAGR